MAKRKRKRRRRRSPARAPAGTSTPAATAGDPPTETPSRAGAPPRRAAGPPPAPWGAFPLSELVILLSLILLLAGFFVEPPRGAVMIGAGLVLGSLAGLELAAREHFSGYRSHTLVIAGAAGMATLAGTFALTEIHPAICLAAGATVFGIAAWALAGAFRRRSGGALFRISS